MEPTIRTDSQKSEVSDQKFFATARILCDVRGVEQTGNNYNALRTGRDDLFEIVDLDSADAKDRERYIDMHAFDVAQTYRFVIGLSRRCKDRTEPDVIRAFAPRGDGLLETVRRFSDNQRPPSFFADNCNRIVILTNVHAFHWNSCRDLGVVIHDQRRGRSRCNLVQLAGKIDNFAHRLPFPAQLNKIDIPFDHCLDHARSVCDLHVA